MILGYITARNPNRSSLDADPVQNCCCVMIVMGFYISERN